MRSDEQVYPIEKSTDIENVWSLSAFQIGLLLRAADPEAMYGAARDYLSTAENLDAMADEIRRGATDLADTWRGDAAHESQHQLRRYYASARSLATACRASAAAMNNAAMALEAAQVHAKYLHPDFNPADYPSTDPTSIESRNYQKLLNDLNSAYRDACTLAPNQIAVNLPGQRDRVVRKASSEWEDLLGSGASFGVNADPGDDGGREDLRPLLMPPLIPANAAGHSKGPGGGGGGSQDHKVPPMWPPLDPDELDGCTGAESRSPYDTGSALAGGGGASGIGSGLGGLDRSRPRSIPLLGDNPALGTGAGGMPGGRPGVGGVAGASGSQGVYPPGQRQRDEERDRERRYYLKEERGVWGEQNAAPAVLYGEYRPPKHDDEDDDDF